ncbi:MAG: hypothetical protein HW403_825 [Dehalococcoidia bacterium]|nr:hypothetical protein [Dehalococcoidia bacterium]
MKRIGFSLVIAVILGMAAFSMAPAQPAAADAGPHGNYSATTAKCMACHRAHAAQASFRLLFAAVDTKTQLCITCHNGTGSVLDVINGRKLGTTIGDSDSAANAGIGTYTKYSDQSAADYDIWITKAAEYIGPTSPTSATYTINVRNKHASAAKTVDLTLTAGATSGFDTTASAWTGTGPWTKTLTAIPAGTTDSSVTFAVAKNGTTPPADKATQMTVLDASIASAQVTQAKVATRYFTSDPAAALNLLGGGFEYYNGARVTSRHDADPNWNDTQPWGNAGSSITYAQLAGYAAGTPAGTPGGQTGQRQTAVDLATDKLQCTGCHNPHGTKNYRLLKDKINGVDVEVYAYDEDSATFTKDETPKDYVNEQYGAKQTGALGGAATGTFANFCGSCHSAYPSDGATVGLTSGGVTRFRHRTEMTMWQWADPRGTTFRSNPELEGYVSGVGPGADGVMHLPLANDGATATSTTVTASSVTLGR